MDNPDDWKNLPVLDGGRVWLEPLRVDHAREMAALLDDAALHRFTGGRPASPRELREAYRRRVGGRSPDGTQRWLNWVVCRLRDQRALGTVQATVSRGDGSLTAEVAWVIATAYQGCGYAREAAQVMVAWLRRQGAGRVVAHVHPEHFASAVVARSVGLAPTTVLVDGEVRWQS